MKFKALRHLFSITWQWFLHSTLQTVGSLDIFYIKLTRSKTWCVNTIWKNSPNSILVPTCGKPRKIPVYDFPQSASHQMPEKREWDALNLVRIASWDESQYRNVTKVVHKHALAMLCLANSNSVVVRSSVENEVIKTLRWFTASAEKRSCTCSVLSNTTSSKVFRCQTTTNAKRVSCSNWSKLLEVWSA